MKVAAFSESSSYPHRDIKPAIKHLTAAYGADRMIYGGGFSADSTPESYLATIAKARALINHLSAPDQEKIFGGTAARIFSFK
jgi:predicted TIM-barrel fold metal-dependent hydrolase